MQSLAWLLIMVFTAHHVTLMPEHAHQESLLQCHGSFSKEADAICALPHNIYGSDWTLTLKAGPQSPGQLLDALHKALSTAVATQLELPPGHFRRLQLLGGLLQGHYRLQHLGGPVVRALLIGVPAVRYWVGNNLLLKGFRCGRVLKVHAVRAATSILQACSRSPLQLASGLWMSLSKRSLRHLTCME